jgi:GH24 family phage-related lysozyme (muramidase)
MKMAGNPMLDVMMKAMGIDGNHLLKQAQDLGAAFQKIIESLARLEAQADAQTDMLWSIQIAMGISPAGQVDNDAVMALLIADESRKHMGRVVLDHMGLAMETDSGGDAFPGVGVVSLAYAKLEELLKIREGVKLEIYEDTNGRLTGGIGHLITEANDEAHWGIGDLVSQEQCDAWFRADAKAAMDAAIKQMAEAKITSADFLPRLASVNFQLGVNWTKEFSATWAMIMARNYTAAASHLFLSEWHEQTPVRVTDFQAALRALPGNVDPV